MEYPKYSLIVSMSDTPEGALDAAILKWQWMCTATKKELGKWGQPMCGLCHLHRHDSCSRCVLKTCEVNSIFHKAALAKDKYIIGEITLTEYRIKARAMRDRLKKLRQKLYGRKK